MKKQPNPWPPVLYEDDWLIAFDKPSGLLVAPDSENKDRPCLIQLVREHLSPGIFNTHRIDTDISGIVLCAKTKPALSNVTGQFQKHEETRRYLALVVHAPPEDEMEIAKPVEADPEHPGVMKISGAKHAMARTRLRVMDRWRGYSLLNVTPETSKTHQIRVHLAHIGCPVLADPLYGSAGGLKLSAIKPRYQFKPWPERPLLDRLALHAESLSFIHPETKASLTLRAPLPKDFAIAIKYLNQFAGTGFHAQTQA
ncbi:MAG: RNA pseudouridine synthase [Verrucomicrobia bacterium]|nr:RNA pseudouridine synthase [Verrucomicrobiota bacterium]MBU4216216.1 RNA pseudouridine synthase [Actinomycetota bacterium]MBU4427769.1 RNA pseudouridine synthase [Verrucomicrobiota bacterium]MBU4496882.1 RNA pseudouridine synthase [Verrucomicrobiota bacterium]MCG2678445.1 pseudouridine synthase [Kiritimatiellia bacterium]